MWDNGFTNEKTIIFCKINILNDWKGDLKKKLKKPTEDMTNRIYLAYDKGTPFKCSGF